MSRARGFTLVEVVVALLVLEVSILGALATMAAAAETWRRAERLERATGAVETVLDSLRGDGTEGASARVVDDVRIRWTVSDSGSVEIEAIDPADSSLVRVRTTIALGGQ
jgi:type II secretory pathway pseudopilin PulG